MRTVQQLAQQRCDAVSAAIHCCSTLLNLCCAALCCAQKHQRASFYKAVVKCVFCSLYACVVAICMQPTIMAPFVPHSSRYNQAGTLLSTLATWAPLPLISAFVGFQNRLLYNQVIQQFYIRSGLLHEMCSYHNYCLAASLS